MTKAKITPYGKQWLKDNRRDTFSKDWLDFWISPNLECDFSLVDEGTVVCLKVEARHIFVPNFCVEIINDQR